MLKRLGIILLIIGLAGCLRGTAPPPLVLQYIIEYPPPERGNIFRTEELLKVERFSVDRSYTGPAMLFRKGPFLREAYHEHRWRVSPGDMVTDFLKRDLRHAGLFQAVLSARDAEETRFVLEGGGGRISRSGEGESRKALLVVMVTLLDRTSQEVSRRVVFQKTYRCEASHTQEGAAGLAEAMSRAMSQFSSQVITDIGNELQKGGR
ncbi:MAG: PqiC family protein [Deltaproteobacteria bacterium]|nr:PqiC family protein [Deltaproteobacteria bacterium]